ncbi:Methyltransferase FkbM [Burkholderiales bacterium]
MNISNIKHTLKRVSRRFGFDLRSHTSKGYCDPSTLGKAQKNIERFREIVSDPLNLMIERVPESGYIVGDSVVLHNGALAIVHGPHAYYDDFSEILIINRGVHEPLEEFCFQQLLKMDSYSPSVMIELGAYWGHYSMWAKRAKPEIQVVLVEPDPHNLACGQKNFARNLLTGKFIRQEVGLGKFGIDDFLEESGLSKISILHSDIQGAEIEMLNSAQLALKRGQIDYIFLSTHSESIHGEAISLLATAAYRCEVSSPYASHTTSCDGFILASSQLVQPVFENFAPLGRLDIARSSKTAILNYLSHVNSISPTRRSPTG